MDVSKSIRLQIVGYSSNWIKKFDVRDYVKNPPLIEKLHEEKQLALATSLDLESKMQKLNEKIHFLELENNKLSALLSSANQKRTIKLILSITSLILMGLGVNIVSSKPYVWAGWVMIGSSCILQIAMFLIKPDSSE